MKRIILALTLVSTSVLGLKPAAAQDYYYQGGYPVQYQYPAQQQDNQVLKKVLIGGALLGAGFLAGRLTAPRPNYGYGNYPPPVVKPYPTNYGHPHHAHHGGHHHGRHYPVNYRGR